VRRSTGEEVGTRGRRRRRRVLEDETEGVNHDELLP